MAYHKSGVILNLKEAREFAQDLIEAAGEAKHFGHNALLIKINQEESSVKHCDLATTHTAESIALATRHEIKGPVTAKKLSKKVKEIESAIAKARNN